MIRLANGHELEFLAASGSLGFDGRGWPWEWPARWVGLWDNSDFTIVLKTLTYYPRRGNLRLYNPHQVVKWLPGGIVNSIGLTNPGISVWMKKVAPKLSPKLRFIVSISPFDHTEAANMAKMLNDLDIVAIEFNASCPNSREHSAILGNIVRLESFTEHMARVSRHPIILKLSCEHEYLQIVGYLRDIIAAVSINSVPWPVAFPYSPSPLRDKYGPGGVSGRAAQPHTWKMIDELLAQGKVPVIGSSVWRYRDMLTLREKGVKAIAFGSVFIKYPWNVLCPWLPNKYIEQWRAEYRRF